MDRQYFARQLNGPIITAIFNKIYDFFHIRSLVDNHCEYFKNLSIDTASEYQLRTIGQLMGMQRFKIIGIDMTDTDRLTFTNRYADQSLYPDEIGFSENYIEARGIEEPAEAAGYFTELHTYTLGDDVVLPTESFRTLLKSLMQHKNSCSLSFIITVISMVVGNRITFNLVRRTDILDAFTVNLSSNASEAISGQLSVILENIYKDYIQFNVVVVNN